MISTEKYQTVLNKDLRSDMILLIISIKTINLILCNNIKNNNNYLYSSLFQQKNEIEKVSRCKISVTVCV